MLEPELKLLYRINAQSWKDINVDVNHKVESRLKLKFLELELKLLHCVKAHSWKNTEILTANVTRAVETIALLLVTMVMMCLMMKNLMMV